jgi:hypothetical protein
VAVPAERASDRHFQNVTAEEVLGYQDSAGLAPEDVVVDNLKIDLSRLT